MLSRDSETGNRTYEGALDHKASEVFFFKGVCDVKKQGRLRCEKSNISHRKPSLVFKCDISILEHSYSTWILLFRFLFLP